ncbi:hypothetical protein F511_13404 [Dorcoceras hygrometricum]|uniref:Uncharacterized protein n=1 Tax=Dorcoceras hygrometricum TaxID=472368 RepID=A0A2Z7DBG0_9LAMI|nr:hypothetical protein F511_13404 [Dorcoceras hygrometricum]
MACGAWPHAAASCAAYGATICARRRAYIARGRRPLVGHQRTRSRGKQQLFAQPCAKTQQLSAVFRAASALNSAHPSLVSDTTVGEPRRIRIAPPGEAYLCDPQWFRDTASRGPTIIVAPESQFWTCPTDHDSIVYPRMSASDESSTTMHRLLHASGSHPIPPPDDPK